ADRAAGGAGAGALDGPEAGARLRGGLVQGRPAAGHEGRGRRLLRAGPRPARPGTPARHAGRLEASAKAQGPKAMPYRETGAGLVWERATPHGDVDAPLTNFLARITG